jgi:cell shape-determining protein MreC
MLFWTLQITIISIILIFLVHHLILFFKSTLTVPKVKDLVNAPAQKYENIYNTISSRDYTDSLLPTIPLQTEQKSMKEELKNFLKSKASNEVSGDIGATSIAMLESFSSPNFSSY